MDDDERDDLTPDEAEDAREEGTTGDVAHREGEFDYLRDILKDVLDEMRGLREDVARQARTAAAVNVGNGATVTDAPDVDDGPEVVVSDEAEDPRDRDYTIER